ncbi:MAG: DoxX family membrane protein [Bdellovibrionales bacterium]
MLVSFFESIKYIGHQYPIAFFRIYLGFHFLSSALYRAQSGFLERPQLSGMIQEFLPSSSASDWYKTFLESVVVPQWQFFAYSITYLEFIIAISLIIGLLVRPISLVAIALCINFIFISDPGSAELYKLFVAVFITMAWVGAGRCLGADYYFFKRQRGIWF